jgi:uncharacterized protein YcgI (DUF1989 family)
MSTHTKLKQSKLNPKDALFREVVDAGRGFSRVVKKGQTLRIVDLEGNQAVDTLFYDAHDPSNRYSSVDTIREQATCT